MSHRPHTRAEWMAEWERQVQDTSIPDNELTFRQVDRRRALGMNPIEDPEPEPGSCTPAALDGQLRAA